MNDGGVEVTVQVAALGFFGEDHRRAEIVRGHAGDRDTGCLHGEDPGDPFVLKSLIKSLADLI